MSLFHLGFEAFFPKQVPVLPPINHEMMTRLFQKPLIIKKYHSPGGSVLTHRILLKHSWLGCVFKDKFNVTCVLNTFFKKKKEERNCLNKDILA